MTPVGVATAAGLLGRTPTLTSNDSKENTFTSNLQRNSSKEVKSAVSSMSSFAAAICQKPIGAARRDEILKKTTQNNGLKNTQMMQQYHN